MQVVKLCYSALQKNGILKLADLLNYDMAKIMHQLSKQTLLSQHNCLFDPLSTVHEPVAYAGFFNGGVQ